MDQNIDNNKSNRRNTIVLMVMFLAVLIVTIIGATFAYLASSVQNTNVTNIEINTNAGDDILLIYAGHDALLHAGTSNFYQNAPDVKADINSSVELQNKSGHAVYDYNVYVDIKGNDFKYTSGKCYDGTSVVSDIENEGICKARGLKWQSENVTEIALDFYEGEKASENSCINNGVCVNKQRAIVNANSKSSCESAGNTWLSNVYENGICYKAIKTVDVTTLTDNNTKKEVELLTNKRIKSDIKDETVKHYYKTFISLINLDHNQSSNMSKEFTASIYFEKVD